MGVYYFVDHQFELEKKIIMLRLQLNYEKIEYYHKNINKAQMIANNARQ